MRYVTENRSYVDVVQILLGVALFVTPWVFAFTGVEAAAWHAWIAGVVIAGVGGLSLVSAGLHYWASWATLAIGLWLILAPWLVAFSGVAAALWSHLVIGVLTVVIALIELAAAHQEQPHVRA